MIKYFIALVLFLSLSLQLDAQSTQAAKYWVRFTDKVNTPYSVYQAQDYLSPRALERRQKQGIAITESDLPVDPAYLAAIRGQVKEISHVSKWLNAATVVAEPDSISALEQLPMVAAVDYIGAWNTTQKKRNKGEPRKSIGKIKKIDRYYGYGTIQTGLIRAQALHELNGWGQGKLVAVMDGGFINVDESPFFDSLRMAGLLLQGMDFVDQDREVFESSGHGTQVLSTMAANQPGLLVGTAPYAHYVLIKTEDVRNEYLVEECNWVVGLEWADSLGADIVNSSLGYTTFNDEEMNYKYADLDGRTSRASLAADIAYSKGMIVVNSAGNSGAGSWKYIGTPADAFDIVAVGGIDWQGRRASFSSFGPSYDGRVKPTVAVMGQEVAVAAVNSFDITFSNGTSFASPTLAGVFAALWSAFPEATNEEIVAAVRQSGHLYPGFSDELGYGIPDLLKAYRLMQGSDREGRRDDLGQAWVWPNVVEQEAGLLLLEELEEEAKVSIKDLTGEVLIEAVFPSATGYLHRFSLPDIDQLIPGFYHVQVQVGIKLSHSYMIKK